MRTQAEFDAVYLALNISVGVIAKAHIEGISDGYEMEKERSELNNIFNLMFAYAVSWPYMEDKEKNEIFDFMSQYLYN